jgi:hypothetical protein
LASSAFDRALAHNPRIGLFFRLGVIMADGQPFRVWLGIGDCRAGIDAADGGGAIYKGMGEVLGVAPFQQLINGAAERVTFQLPRVSARVLELANAGSDEVKGAPLNIGLGLFDEDWQLIGQPFWLKRFVCDYLSVALQQQGTDETIHTVSLSARSIFTARRRPGLSFFTSEDQDRRSPGDRFCEQVPRYSNEAKTWPRG